MREFGLKVLAALTLLTYASSRRQAQSPNCQMEALKKAFTDYELRELEITLGIGDSNHLAFLNRNSSSTMAGVLCPTLQKHLHATCAHDGAFESIRKSFKMNGVSISRGMDGNRLYITHCSNRSDRCIKYEHIGKVDDFILTSNGLHTFYTIGTHVYLSSVKNFAANSAPSMAVLNVSARKLRMTFANPNLNLLYETCGDNYEAVNKLMLYRTRYHERKVVLTEDLQSLLSDPELEMKQLYESGYDAKVTRDKTSMIVALSIGVPLAVLFIIVFVAMVLYSCCFSKNGDEADRTDEDAVPQSLIENARKAQPRASQREKFLPENFNVEQFQFKGPLVIEKKPEFTTLHELEGDAPVLPAPQDRIEFDEGLNEAYEIGEGIEQYGVTKAISSNREWDTQKSPEVNHAAAVEAAAVKELRDAKSWLKRDQHQQLESELNATQKTEMDEEKPHLLARLIAITKVSADHKRATKDCKDDSTQGSINKTPLEHRERRHSSLAMKLRSHDGERMSTTQNTAAAMQSCDDTQHGRSAFTTTHSPKSHFESTCIEIEPRPRQSTAKTCRRTPKTTQTSSEEVEKETATQIAWTDTGKQQRTRGSPMRIRRSLNKPRNNGTREGMSQFTLSKEGVDGLLFTETQCKDINNPTTKAEIGSKKKTGTRKYRESGRVNDASKTPSAETMNQQSSRQTKSRETLSKETLDKPASLQKRSISNYHGSTPAGRLLQGILDSSEIPQNSTTNKRDETTAKEKQQKGTNERPTSAEGLPRGRTGALPSNGKSSGERTERNASEKLVKKSTHNPSSAEKLSKEKVSEQLSREKVSEERTEKVVSAEKLSGKETGEQHSKERLSRENVGKNTSAEKTSLSSTAKHSLQERVSKEKQCERLSKEKLSQERTDNIASAEKLSRE